MKQLFTIGHSNHEIARFLELLSTHDVEVVADVRSSPYSQWAPQYSKAPLEASLRTAGFDYWFLGKELGARREEDCCYVNNQAKYAHIAELPIFRRGLDRVLEGAGRLTIALLCSEADPITCHRTILVCRELLRAKPSLDIAHIRADASIESHGAMLERLAESHELQPELFGPLSTAEGIIEHAYDLQADRIEYRKVLAET
ncbi:MAG: DUF488 domain-containing protein [Candidatus Hydrogenedentes bacterium]|nr:DUF488 domain-containing protein [Candidatus Hydrogenedentota bacterium]